MLSEISPRKTNTKRSHLHVESKNEKKKVTTKLADTEIDWWSSEVGWGEVGNE